MKEKKLKYIVLIMTVAVIGLIGTQVYWISNIISIEKEKFDRTVQEALLRVTAKLEKHETANAVIRKITPGQHDVVLFMNEMPTRGAAKDSLKTRQMIRIQLSGNDTENISYAVSSDSLPKGTRIKASAFVARDSAGLIWNRKIDTIKVKRAKLVQDVVTELVSAGSDKDIKDRINESTLDKYLKSEFSNSGIDTDYYFGVFNLSNDSLVISKSGSDKARLTQSNLRCVLFPDEILRTPGEIAVYFPNRFGFILKTASGMLILSIVLIIVIVAVFQKTFTMLLSQKKITQIKNDLINNITHEFKTPISSISLACEALNEPELVKNGGSVKRYSSIIKEENDRLGMMVDTLLNTAALEKGDLQFTTAPCDIHSLLLETTAAYNETVNDAGGHFDIILDAAKYVINGDKFHTKNIFRNLIDNAVKYNDKKPAISVNTRSTPSDIYISIADNGIGIEKQNIEKIFDTFFRVQSGDIQNVRGNGIGLSYAKQIVEFLGGKISLTSKPGEGSTFEIILPLLTESDEKDQNITS